MTGIEARFRGRFGSFALDVALSCPPKGITGLFGPSGCGKTTVLRCIAGLARTQEGFLRVDGQVWQHGPTFLPPHRRPVGYVFQDARLFAHLSVQGNLEYGLRRAALSGPGISRDAVVELLGLGGLLSRATGALSGGERQRVAIGRALLAQPRLLLMDEPLSALDHAAKRDILPYLENLADAFAIPILYVSHDLSELERLADRLVVMSRDGRVAAQGGLAELASDLSLPLARAPGAAAVLKVVVTGYDDAYDISQCCLGAAQFLVPGALGPPHTVRRVRIAASDVSLVKHRPEASSVLNILPARVVSHETLSPRQVLVVLALEGAGHDARVLSNVTRRSWAELGLGTGDPVFVQIKGMALAETA